MLQIYCGDGKGKTTAAVGQSIRFAGTGKKVLFVQFCKDGSSPEIKVLDSINLIDTRYYSENLGFFFSMKDEQRKKAEYEYQNLFDSVVNDAHKYEMVVLDEIISTYNFDIVKKNSIEDFLIKNKQKIEIIITGRDPSDKLLELGDYVSEVKKIKHPYDSGKKARLGIEY